MTDIPSSIKKPFNTSTSRRNWKHILSKSSKHWILVLMVFPEWKWWNMDSVYKLVNKIYININICCKTYHYPDIVWAHHIVKAGCSRFHLASCQGKTLSFQMFQRLDNLVCLQNVPGMELGNPWSFGDTDHAMSDPSPLLKRTWTYSMGRALCLLHRDLQGCYLSGSNSH